MKQNDKFLIIGGDTRQLYMADFLEKSGYNVEIYGLPQQKRKNTENLKNTVKESNIIILPLPISKDGRYVFSLVPMKETIDDIVSMLSEKHIVFAGMLSKPMEIKLGKNKSAVHDYFKREEVTVMNAVPTVQGILKAMIDNIEYTINSSRIAVFGYGRIATVTADVLSSIGAHVTVCARKYSDLARAETKGIDSCLIKDFIPRAHEFDMIINTVPSVILDKNLLNSLRTECLIIDVASAPYGTDFAAASELGLNAILCSSLPGKVAPKTAGEIIANGVLNTLREEYYG